MNDRKQQRSLNHRGFKCKFRSVARAAIQRLRPPLRTGLKTPTPLVAADVRRLKSAGFWGPARATVRASLRRLLLFKPALNRWLVYHALAVLLWPAGMLMSAENQVVAGALVAEEKAAPTNWLAILKQGKLTASARYRYEIFDRDEPAYPQAPEASTLRLALGYETPTFYGFSALAEYEGVYALGPSDYNIPNDPAQHKPGYPNILDPLGSELNQGWVSWKWKEADYQVALTAGRQEVMLNDGRFVSVSFWRQNHQSLDAAQLKLDLPHEFALTYAYIGQVHRVVGGDATDGQPTMNSHLYDLRWKRNNVINISAYGLFLDYQQPALYSNSTRTLGLRVEGPWKLAPDWALCYTAEFAQQADFGENPNAVNANYWLGELGFSYKGHTLKGGVAWLGGRSLTDKLSTPLAHPFNGRTELFAANPSVGRSHGLEADYLTATGPIGRIPGLTYNLTFYDYHSANDRVHYGSELDGGMSWKVKPVCEKWEVGWRCSKYWADELFGDALRYALYTSFTF